VSGLQDKEVGCTEGIPKRPNGNHAVGNSARGPTRAGKFRQAEVARALKGAQKANVPVACVKIEPDGSILLVLGQPPTVPSSPSPNPWDGES
jgi:hypothetical protein